MKISLLIIFSVLFITSSPESNSQVINKSRGTDTTFIFKSPRPLINPGEIDGKINGAFGFDMIFSNSGFGGGIFYNRKLQEDLFFNGSFFISSARKDDEIEYWNSERQEYRVPDKINRIYNMPLTLGLQKFFLKGVLVETLRPYASFGVGASMIITTPYDYEYFHAFRYTRSYYRFATYIGFGAEFGDPEKSLMGVSFRYYYIPYGGKGLESIKDDPINDFGGLFIKLHIGKTF